MTIDEILESLGLSENDDLRQALFEREEELIGLMLMVAARFGMYPQIVAEAFSEIGLGRPRSDEEKTLIHQQFVQLMERLQRGEA